MCWYHAIQGVAKGAPYLIPGDELNYTVVLFTKEVYAAEAAKSLKTIPLEIRKVEGMAVGLFFTTLFRLGATRIIVDLGYPSGGEASRDEVLGIQDEKLKGYRMVDSRLYALMLYHLQSKKLAQDNADKIAAAYWLRICKEFSQSLFFLPVAVGGTGEEKANELFVTSRAAAVIQELQPVIEGTKGYQIVNPSGRKIGFLTASPADKSKTFLPVFTSLPELRASFLNHGPIP